MLKERFADYKSFAFLDLANPDIFKEWERSIVPNLLPSLKDKYGSLFHIQAINCQLFFTYNDYDFHKVKYYNTYDCHSESVCQKWLSY